MIPSSQLLITFVLNACWQIILVAGLAAFSDWMLRNSPARYRHRVWVAALLVALSLPVVTSLRLFSSVFTAIDNNVNATEYQNIIEPLVPFKVTGGQTQLSSSSSESIPLNRTLVVVLLLVYVGILGFSMIRLLLAWQRTRLIRFNTIGRDKNERVRALVQKCSLSICGRELSVEVLFSDDLPVPITIGVFRPVIVIPTELLNDVGEELLTSAIGHELVHVKRQDYGWNLLYEFLYLPLSFHPAAALIRRRIRQTRELSCDELVAERILNREVYARSLVKLASSAPTVRRLSVSTTVGIADADILEARIMSLLRKPKMDTRLKRITLIAISLLLLVPCLAAASFAMKFDLLPSEPEMAAQEPSQERERVSQFRMVADEAQESLIEKKRMNEEEFKRKMSTDPKFREEVEKQRMNEEEFKRKMATDALFREEVETKWEFERKMRAARQTALLRLARISMDQAIQIATSQQPGKVLECTLNAEHWEEPGKLAKDGFVFYHVVIVSEGDSEEGISNHVLVNAVDGTIIRKEKELPRKMKRPE